VPTWREVTQERKVEEMQRLELEKIQIQRQTEMSRQVGK
jgi:hypothetical protein